MRRILITALALLLVCTASFIAGVAASSTVAQKITIRDVMTQEEYDAAGLWKLTDSNAEALDAWLNRYRERISKEARGEPYEVEEPAELAKQTKAEVCANAGLPQGWVKVGDRWNPTKCGSPTSIVYNVAEIERYTDKAVGAEMTVCSDTPTPSGWEEVRKRWNPTTCGHPSSIIENVKTIKKVK